MQWLVLAAAAAAFAGSAAASVPPNLSGPEWVLTAMNGAALPVGRAPAIAFTNDRVPDTKLAAMSGFSGCNRYFGGYALAPGGKIEIQVRGMTRMACAPARMSLERRFQAALTAAAFYEWRYDKTLTLVSADGKTRLAFKQSDVPAPR
jgi:heat shock protein HslJ